MKLVRKLSARKDDTMIQLTSKGDWKKTRTWLQKVTHRNPYKKILQKYGERGVIALRDNTPALTGVTAESWYYDIVEEEKGIYKLVWSNENLINDWFNVALYLQLGHATRNGTWVEGVDYINPALAPIFNEMANKVWVEITSN